MEALEYTYNQEILEAHTRSKAADSRIITILFSLRMWR